jgi:hypothetical protein
MPINRAGHLAWPYIDYTHPLTKGCVFAGLAPHPGGWDYHDCSPYRNHGTLTGYASPASGWNAELNRNVLVTTGSPTKVALSLLPLIDIGNINTYTIFAWFKTTSSAQQEVIGWSASGKGSAPLIQFGTFGGKAQYMHRSDALVSAKLLETGPIVTDDLWHSLAMVRSAVNAFAFFLDGVQIGSSTNSVGTTTFTGVAIGCLPRTLNEFFFTGMIGDVAVWVRSLSSAELSLLSKRSDPTYDGWIIGTPRPTRRTYVTAPVSGWRWWFPDAKMVGGMSA